MRHMTTITAAASPEILTNLIKRPGSGANAITSEAVAVATTRDMMSTFPWVQSYLARSDHIFTLSGPADRATGADLPFPSPHHRSHTPSPVSKELVLRLP